MKQSKYNKGEVTHFRKSDGMTHFYKVEGGRLYVWVLDRWMFECWIKNFPHKLEQI